MGLEYRTDLGFTKKVFYTAVLIGGGYLMGTKGCLGSCVQETVRIARNLPGQVQQVYQCMEKDSIDDKVSP